MPQVTEMYTIITLSVFETSITHGISTSVKMEGYITYD